MTLHEAIVAVLADQPNRTAHASVISQEIARRRSYLRKDGSPPPPSQIRARAKNYKALFEKVAPATWRLLK